MTLDGLAQIAVLVCQSTEILKCMYEPVYAMLFCLCVDVNECSTKNGGCQHTCQNVNGSYACQCKAGYTLNIDGHRCDGMFFINLYEML